MWYVIQTISGKEQEVCSWINACLDKALYRRCFVPLYEDVWRKAGTGHISIKKMFPGYLFLETDNPELIYEALKNVSQLTVLLSEKQERNERLFLPIRKEEELFLDSVLSDGLMKVSYVHMNRKKQLDTVIGPLQSYTDQIVKLDLPHRRAIVEISVLGRKKRVKFGLWLDRDSKLTWIEQEKRNRIQSGREQQKKEQRPDNPWDWKEWKKINADRAMKQIEENEFQVGDYVINTTGIYGNTPLEIVETRKNSVVVNVPIFGSMTRVEMGIGEVEFYENEYVHGSTL